jgi:nucleoside-diphosphate-sugar epimerase
MAKALVTGAAGFIGSSLVKQLVADGHSVAGIDNLSSGNLANLQPVRHHMQFHCGNICDSHLMRQLCAGVDIVFHEAALPSVPKSVLDPLTSHVSNIDGTLSVLLAARDAGVARLVYAASSSAYGDSTALPKYEAMPTAPVSPYAVQKLAGEHYMQSFSRVYGIETVCLRYFNVFGPCQAADSPYSGVLAKFITEMLGNITPTIYGDGSQTRDFIYIQNVVRANMLAASAPGEKVSGKVYNIACGESHTLLETYEILARLTGFGESPIFAALRDGDIQHSLADITQARNELQYEPEIGFEEGLSRTIEWYAAKLALDMNLGNHPLGDAHLCSEAICSDRTGKLFE